MTDFRPLDAPPPVTDRLGRRCHAPAPEGVQLSCVLPEDHFTEHAAFVKLPDRPIQWYGWTS